MIAVAAALAGTERAAWPSLPVEQPVTAPRGWVLLDGSLGVAPEAGAAAGSVRYGFSAHTETFLGAEASAPPRFGVRHTLAASEAARSSAAVELAVDAALAVEAGLRGAVATGPVRWSLGGLARWADGPAAVAEGAALLQLGPLAPSLRARLDEEALDWAPGLQVNLSRGVAPWLEAGGSRPGVRLGLRLAL